MSDNVDTILKRLEEQYIRGRNARDNFADFYSSSVPSREIEPRVIGRRTEIDGTPENVYTLEMLKTARKIATDWTQATETILKDSGKARYKLQFGSSRGTPFATPAKNMTKTEQDLYDTINHFSQRVDELHTIIVDMETASEQQPRPVPSSIAPARYDDKSQTLFFADKAIRFRRNAPFTPALCQTILSKPDKLWTLRELQVVWDDYYELMDSKRPTDWHRVYEAVNRLNERIRKQTGISDLFLLTTTSVRLNPKYAQLSQ